MIITDISLGLNQLIHFHLNNTLNLRLLTTRIIPSKWRSYREHRLRDVISPYLFSGLRHVLTPPPTEVRAANCDDRVPVCLFVSLSVRISATTRPIFA